MSIKLGCEYTGGNISFKLKVDMWMVERENTKWHLESDRVNWTYPLS